MKLTFFLVSALIFVQNFAQHTNVLISTANSPNEPSIFISPTHPDTMIAASNIRNYYLSYDAGFTWTEHTLSSTYGVWGDPVIVADTTGDFYFFHLSNPPSGNWIDRIVCQKTTDAGQTWNNGSFMGLNGSKVQDKHWVIVDQNNNTMYCTWTEFDNYGSTSASCKSRIMFSKSVDAGATWSAAFSINETDGNCVDEDETTEGAVPAVGPNGEIYVSWAGPDGLVFDKSLDAGNTWLTNDVFVNDFTNGWDFAIPGLGRANGLPITKCDLSGGLNHGTIYINWSDQSNGENNTDVWLVKSLDGGITWTSPKKVNQDNTETHQFFTWMDIDQSTGYLYFVYYDRRAYTDNQTDVYLAYSVDGGETFKEEKISDDPFLPSPGIFFGDYNNVAAQNGVVRPIWTRLHNANLSVYTAIIDTSLLDYSSSPLDTGSINITEDKVFKVKVENYPNPVENTSYFSFKLHKKTSVSLVIYDAVGNKVTKLVNEPLEYGKHIFSLKPKELNMSYGMYYYVLKFNNKTVKQSPFIVE